MAATYQPHRPLGIMLQAGAFIAALGIYLWAHAFGLGVGTPSDLDLTRADKVVVLAFFILFYIGAFLHSDRITLILSLAVNFCLLPISVAVAATGWDALGWLVLTDPWIVLFAASLLLSGLLVILGFEKQRANAASAPKKKKR